MGLLSFIKELFSSKEGLSAKSSTDDMYHKSFNPTLVASLKGDHQALLGIFGRIQTAVQHKNDQELYVALQEFGKALNGHLATENVKFYSYIEEKYAKDPEISKRIREYRMEMEHIGVVVTKFLRAHTTPQQTEEQWASLPSDLAGLATALGKRIHDEETELYEFYKG